MKIQSFKDFLKLTESVIYPSTIPNTLSLWHGGNLEDEYDESMNHKKGRSEFGPGLYLTTHYQTAKRYSKGSRKFYQIVIEKGNDAKENFLSVKDCLEFISLYVTKSKRQEVITAITDREKDGNIYADIFINIIGNHEAIKSTSTGKLRMFLVSNNIDYIIQDNAFGWGERMIVLFNMKKIISKTIVKPLDKIEVFDLPTDWN